MVTVPNKSEKLIEELMNYRTARLGGNHFRNLAGGVGDRGRMRFPSD